ncbi:MAG: transaldolase family protein [Longicatena sp.]
MYIDTANIKELKEALKTGVIKGVTTNPTILKKENKPRFQQINEIMDLKPSILFVQILGSTTDELIADFHKVMDFAKEKKYNIGIKVPMNFIGLETVKTIKNTNPEIKVLGTAIYSADQVILSAIAGCDYVAPYINRMQNNGIDPFEQVSIMRTYIDNHNLSCEILAASFKNTSQISEALTSGAHTCTIPFDLLKAMMDKELALNAIQVFNTDGYSIE